jgi:hypothetical protein
VGQERLEGWSQNKRKAQRRKSGTPQKVRKAHQESFFGILQYSGRIGFEGYGDAVIIFLEMEDSARISQWPDPSDPTVVRRQRKNPLLAETNLDRPGCQP